MSTADDQRSVAVGIRQPDPEPRPPDARMEDEAEGLISERLESPGHEWLRRRRPGPNTPSAILLRTSTGHFARNGEDQKKQHRRPGPRRHIQGVRPVHENSPAPVRTRTNRRRISVAFQGKSRAQ